MSLHGTLETFALPDVLTLLSTTGKTGELRVNGDRFDGRVWLDGGLLVGTAVGNAPTFVDALFDLLRLKTGSFSFEADATAPDASTPEPIAPVLEEAQGRLEQWREIEAVVPSMASAVRLVAEVGRERVSLRDGQWRVVVAVAGHRTVGEVLTALGLGEFEGCKVVRDLVAAGLMAVDAAPAAEALPAAQPDAAEVVAQAAEVAEPAEVAGVAQPADVAESRAEEPERPAGRAGGRSRRARAAAAASEQAEVEAADESDSRAMAQALVRQLASLDEVETPKKGAKGRGAEVASAEDVPAEGAGDQPHDGAESDDEPINRGLLLKFLSSVRN